MDIEPFLPGRKSGKTQVDPYEYFKDIFLLLSTLNENDPKRAKGQIQSYQFAFCLSKCDLPAIWEQRNNVAEFAGRIFGDDVIGEIRRHIPEKNYTWHAFSAIGPYFVDQRSELPVADKNKIRDDHVIKPYGVKEIVIGLFMRDINKQIG